MTCQNKEWILKYGVKCSKKNNKIICYNLKKLNNICSSCMYYHIIKCHKNYYALPCMYPCSNSNTGLYNMCPNIEKAEPKKCYKIIGTYSF